MRRALPIWFQALALAVLCLILVGTADWLVAKQANRFNHARDTKAYTLIYLAALVIGYLGLRFFFRFRDLEDRETLADDYFYRAGIIVVIVAFVVLLLRLPPTASVREAGYSVAAAGPSNQSAPDSGLVPRGALSLQVVAAAGELCR